MKTLAIIGSTGSIGKSSLNVYFKNKKKFKLIYICAYSDYVKLSNQYKKYRPKYYNILQENKKKLLKNKSKIKNLNYFIKKKTKIDYVISGLSGFDALDYNFELLKISKNLLIANKETIICGGEIFLKYAKKYNCNIVPIDSEHHCIDFFLKNFKSNNLINKITILASGGPFLKKKKVHYKEKIFKVLKHPNWKMGKEITVNSSTLANKVLELFEAKILFNIPTNKLDIKIENTSNCHAIISFKNNIHFFISHFPSMQVPLSNALNVENNFKLKINNKNFLINKIDFKKFPIAKLGFKILKLGYSGMIIFTVLNERLVKDFLNKKINYGDISLYLQRVFKNKKIVYMSKKCIKNKKDIKKVINYSKKIKL